MADKGKNTKLGEFEKEGGQAKSGNNIAQEMASKQREISIAEFFEKNRHLLGFDNKRKALLTTVKEAVDNSLDACEEAKILPEISVEIVDMGNDRFRIIVEDNGPGVVKKQIPKIFAKLLYGSKFHTLKQSRGQQGIGISAAALYGQLTTGRPIRIISRTGSNRDAHYYELHIDTQKNNPEIQKEETVEWKKDHGVKIELDLEAYYQKGGQSVNEYLKQTATINPHATIIYTNPKAEQQIFPRVSEDLPKESKEIKPHPYGVELGILIKMLANTTTKTMQQFFGNEFSRVGAGTAKEICQKASIPPNFKPQKVPRDGAERLIKAIRDTKIIAPPTDCINPLGDDLILAGLKKEFSAEFYAAATRPPNVYRGNPFVIEAGICYGGKIEGDKSAKVLRFANRVPLLYQQGACGITQSITETNWKSYGLQQSNGALPVGPVVILVHFVSVWAPFTSEAKEAIAHYPEIMKEVKLALQECGRQLYKYVAKKRRVGDELKKRSYIEKFLPHIGVALKELIGLDEGQQQRVVDNLKEVLEGSRKEKAQMAKETIVRSDGKVENVTE